MLKVRVIPCLDVKEGRVVKGVNFVDLRDAGDPVEAATAYDEAGADELCFLDITASHEKRGTILDVVARTAERCFMPLTVGGGVRNTDDVRALLEAGADKVSINTAVVEDRDLVRRAAEKFGAQCIVVAIDAKRVGTNGAAPRFEIFTHGGREPTGHRGGRLCAGSGSARRRRNPADLDGPGRHAGRFRHRADAGHRRRGNGAGDRIAAASARSTIWWRGCGRGMPRPCSPPRSSITGSTRSAKPSGSWPRRACPCVSTREAP